MHVVTSILYTGHSYIFCVQINKFPLENAKCSLAKARINQTKIHMMSLLNLSDIMDPGSPLFALIYIIKKLVIRI